MAEEYLKTAPMNQIFQDIFEQHFGGPMQKQLDSISLFAKSPPGTKEAYMGHKVNDEHQPECPCCGEALTAGDELYIEQGTVTGCSHIIERFDALEYVYDRREAG